MSSESSSDDDDMPLASLATTKSSKTERPSRRASRSSSRRNSASNSTSYKEESEEEFEFEDEEPAPPKPDKKKAATKKRKASETATTSKKASSAKNKKSKSEPPKKKKKAAPKKSESSSSSKPSSIIATASSELYRTSSKGKLISEFLCRWWYAMTWPDFEKNPITVPPNCDKLDGFPGVFVTTSGDDVGKIVDTRDDDTCPCFKNMVKKSSEELKTLLLKAIKEQKKILIEKEGNGTSTEKELTSLAKWTDKVNAKKADKEAAKVLKAANLTIEVEWF